MICPVGPACTLHATRPGFPHPCVQVADEYGLETGLALPQAAGTKLPAQQVREGGREGLGQLYRL